MKLLCFVLMMTDCQLTRSGPWHFRPLFECAFMGAHSVMNCRTCVVPCSISCVFSKVITELFTNFSLHSLPTFLIVDFLLHVLNIPKKRTDLCIILLLDMAESQCVFTRKYFCFFLFSIHNFFHHGSPYVYASTFCWFPANQDKWTHGCGRFVS